MGLVSSQKKKSAPARPKSSDRPDEAEQRRQKASAMVEKVLETIETKIENAELKPTVGDYLRLLQYRAEIQQDEQPKEIRVTWVEPRESESAK
jgi:hypothetical protein